MKKFKRTKKSKLNSTKKINLGQGLYKYKNKTNCDLVLGKTSKDDKKIVSLNETWIGDDSYMFFVKTGMADIAEIISLKESEKFLNKKEEVKMEEKLILDQPDFVTQSGKVEHIIGEEGLTEDSKNKKGRKNNKINKNEVLLTDDGVDTIQLLG